MAYIFTNTIFPYCVDTLTTERKNWIPSLARIEGPGPEAVLKSPLGPEGEEKEGPGPYSC